MNTFQRVMAVFLLSLIPLYAIGMSLFSAGSTEIKRQIGNSAANHISLFMESLEKEFIRIQQQKFTAFEDNNLQMLSSRVAQVTDYDAVRAMRDLQQRLFAIKNSSAYVDEVAVYISSIGKVISSFPKIEDYADADVADLVSLSGIGASPVVFAATTPYFIDTFPRGTGPSDGRFSFLFTIRLSTTELRESIRTLSRNLTGVTVLLHPPSGYVLSSTSRFEPDTDLSTAATRVADEQVEGQMEYRIGDVPYVGFYSRSEYANLMLVHFIEEEALYRPLRGYVRFFWLLSVVALLVVVAAAFFTHQLLHRPLVQLVDAFHRLENWDLTVRIEPVRQTEFGYLFGSFNRMVSELNRLISEGYEKELLLQKARYSQLQAQINPHFLYNSFFILQRRIGNEDLEGASRMSTQLGRYFQYVTHNELQDVPLKDEMEHAELYVDIQRIRFGDRISVSFEELPESLERVSVPRLIVQPLLENAFKHGLENRSEGGSIRVAFTCDSDSDDFRIIVEDDGTGLSYESRCEFADAMDLRRGSLPVSGLINIHRRLRLQYGEHGGVTLEESSAGGLRVILRLARTRLDAHD